MAENSFLTISGILDSVLHYACSIPEIISSEPGRYFTRNRKFNSFSVIHYMLTQSAGSLNKTIFEYCEANDIGVKDRPTKQAVIKSRKHLSEKAFPFIFDEFNKRCAGYDYRTFRGFRLASFDGTSLNTAHNPNSDTYMEKQGYNQIHISACYDLLNRVYLGIDIKPKNFVNEPRSACNLVDRGILPKGSIVICDRGYASMNLIEHIRRSGNYYLIRYKDSKTIHEINELPMQELDVWRSRELRTTSTKEDKELFRQRKAYWISGKSKFGKYKSSQEWDFESPCTVRFRIVRVMVAGKIETLVTNLPKHIFSAEELKELYHLRWGIETSFRELKYDEGLKALHTKDESVLCSEVYSHFISYNLCHRVEIIEKPEQSESDKHEKARNRAMAVYACKYYYRKLKRGLINFSEAVARYIEIVRPGRKDKRKAVKPESFIPFCYRIA